jgi:DNA-directed RNA polymerase specialized sigma24 family protein
LKQFLSFSEVSGHILNRLYAAPLNESSCRHAMMLIAHDRKHPVAELLRRIVAVQPAIGNVRSAWETVSTGKFRSPLESDEYFLAAVDTGLVRKLVLHLGGKETTNFLPKDQIVRAWMEIAKDSRDSRTLHPDQQGVSRKPGRTEALFDENYLQALARRDAEAEKFLVTHFSRMVQLNLRARLRSSDLVQDAQQETFSRILQFFHSGETLDNPANLPGFVHAVCDDVALEFERSGMRHMDGETAPECVDPAPGPEAVLVAQQLRKLVNEVLSKAPESDRELLRRVYLEETIRMLSAASMESTAIT